MPNPPFRHSQYETRDYQEFALKQTRDTNFLRSNFLRYWYWCRSIFMLRYSSNSEIVSLQFCGCRMEMLNDNLLSFCTRLMLTHSALSWIIVEQQRILINYSIYWSINSSIFSSNYIKYSKKNLKNSHFWKSEREKIRNLDQYLY